MQNNAVGQSHPLFNPQMVEGAQNSSQINFGGPQGGPPTVRELTGPESYTKAITSNKSVVIDVFTEWCGPCKAIKPFFAQLPTRFTQITFFKMDLDKNKFLGSQLGIQSIPTFLFIQNGTFFIY